MSLTKEDLEAIQVIVGSTVKTIVDESTDSLARSVAAGFLEVHAKIAKVDDKIDSTAQELHYKIDSAVQQLSDKIDVKDGKLENTVQRVDKHEVQLRDLQQKLA